MKAVGARVRKPIANPRPNVFRRTRQSILPALAEVSRNTCGPRVGGCLRLPFGAGRYRPGLPGCLVPAPAKPRPGLGYRPGSEPSGGPACRGYPSCRRRGGRETGNGFGLPRFRASPAPCAGRGAPIGVRAVRQGRVGARSARRKAYRRPGRRSWPAYLADTPSSALIRGVLSGFAFLLVEARHGAPCGGLAGGVPGYRRLRSPASGLHDGGHLDSFRAGEVLRHADPASVA